MTTLFGNVAESTEVQTIPAAAPKKKHGWLPILTVLFMISYGLMTMLIVEQGQTIESQRALIRELFRDSTELSALKIKTQRMERAQAESAQIQDPSSQVQAPSTQVPSTQTPSTQAQRHAPLSQAPLTQAPLTQATPQQRAQIQVKPKSQFQMPSKPASDLQDSRRALITI